MFNLLTDTDNLISTAIDTIIVDQEDDNLESKKMFLMMMTTTTMTKHTFMKKLTKHNLKILITR